MLEGKKGSMAQKGLTSPAYERRGEISQTTVASLKEKERGKHVKKDYPTWRLKYIQCMHCI